MPQPLQLLDVPPGGLLPIPLIEVGSSDLLIRHLVLEHVIDNHQDGVRHGHHRFLVSPMPHDAAVARGQPAVFHANGPQGRFDQRRPQPAVAFAGLAAGVLARALVVARTDAGPTHQMPIRGKGAQVHADLRHNPFDRHSGSPPGWHPAAGPGLRKGGRCSSICWLTRSIASR